MSDRNSDAKYPSWKGAKPNLQTFLTAINLSQPIIQCQYELVWSRWPRTIFFAKSITIPGVSVNTIDINHAGFAIPIPTHVTYENTEVSMNIVADKEGFHYYDLRNMVLQTGHPLVAGDPKATIGNNYKISTEEDILEVRLRNQPADKLHHHWILHNFHPTGIGDMELSRDGASFVEFELKGMITHVTYDCGTVKEEESEEQPSEGETTEEDYGFGVIEDDNESPADNEEEEEGEGESEEDYEDYRYIDDGEPPTEPMPDEPQETKKENVAMSGNEYVISDENGERTINSTSKIGMPNPASETDQIEATACDMRLNDAAKEFSQAIEDISKMPADPNYPSENVSSEEDTFNSVTANDGIKAMGGVSVETTIKSAE